MNNKCVNCAEKCPQAELAHNAALGRMYAMKELVPLLKKIESGELAPVVHGRWEQGYPIFCSVCGGAAATEYEDANRYEAWLSPYCPNCGAKMDGDGNG